MLYIPNFFEPLRKFLKWEKVAIDNFIFRLHYKVTVILFMVFVVLVTAKQHFGDPIECQTSKEKPVESKVVNSFCWLTGTFTKEYIYKSDELACRQSHSHTCYLGAIKEGRERRIEHSYYQWVGWVIFVQALLFYIPRQLWKVMEGGKVKFLTASCPTTPALDEKEAKDRVDKIHKIYNKFVGRNTPYAFKFFFCEALNLLNVIFNSWLVNYFLEGRFSNYGLRVVQSLSSTHFDDPMRELFPKLTTCQFERSGTGGGKPIVVFNMCVLSLNIVNDKVYLIMWFWFQLLFILTSLNLSYRAAALMTPAIRRVVLWRGAHTARWETINFISVNMPIGDWFLLRQVSKNVDEDTFVGLIERLAEAKQELIKKKSTRKMQNYLSKHKDTHCYATYQNETFTEAGTLTYTPANNNNLAKTGQPKTNVVPNKKRHDTEMTDEGNIESNTHTTDDDNTVLTSSTELGENSNLFKGLADISEVANGEAAIAEGGRSDMEMMKIIQGKQTADENESTMNMVKDNANNADIKIPAEQNMGERLIYI